VTDLERFFERLVRNLVATNPERVTQRIGLLELRNDILPYRSNRRALGIESSDEYEELCVRLVGEEDGLVKTDPPEVAEWCQRQMSSLTPDLSGIPGQGSTSILLSPEAIARILGEDTAAGIAKAGAGEIRKEDLPLPPEKCVHCQAPLPSNRAINFCPVCGRNVTAIPCDNCGADMEPGWRFCVNCGQETTDTAATPSQA
jgi:hypothetical protein